MTDRHVVSARPVVLSRVGYAGAAFVLVVFVVVALLMKRDNAGATFDGKDQIGAVLLGVLLAGLLFMLTRPRLVADDEAVRLRSFLGGWRVVPWDLVVRIDFPRKLRFARLVLPGDEALAIYAVARYDKDRAVAVMRALRELYAAHRPSAA